MIELISFSPLFVNQQWATQNRVGVVAIPTLSFHNLDTGQRSKMFYLFAADFTAKSKKDTFFSVPIYSIQDWLKMFYEWEEDAFSKLWIHYNEVA